MKRIFVYLLSLLVCCHVMTAQDVSQLMDSYYEEYRATQKLAYNDRLPTREKLDAKYIALLTPVLGAENAKNTIYETYIKRIMESSEAGNLELSQEMRRDFAVIRHDYDLAIYNVKKSSLSSEEKNKAVNALKNERNEKLSLLLGDERYKKWVRYEKDTHKRYYMSYFGFTELEYSMLKDIDNEYAMERMLAQSQHLSDSEEDMLIELAKEKRVNRIKELLGDARFSKWYELYVVNEKFEKEHGRR